MAFFSGEDQDRGYAALGAADGWSTVAERAFSDLFAERGWGATRLPFPEAYPGARFLPREPGAVAGEHPTAPPLHLSFRPLSRFALLKGASTFYALPWRAPLITRRFARNAPIQSNIAHMLSLPDEIWTSSAYAAGVLRAAGVAHVHAMPAPLPKAAPDREAALSLSGELLRIDAFRPSADGAAGRPARVADLANGRDPLFVAVVDPADPADNLETLLRGFVAAGTAARLVVVLAGEGRRGADQPAAIAARLAHRLEDDADLISDRVLLLDGVPPLDALAGLFALADVYLSAASAADQNLPLLMAMAAGALPVAVRATAMADYLDDANSIAIAAEPGLLETVDPRLAGLVPTMPAELPSVRSVAEACRAATALAPETRAARVAAARAAAARFSAEAVAERVEARLEARAAVRRAAESASQPPLLGPRTPEATLRSAH
ncbi:MAG: glycosyltransferase [Pseudomonadota bacterium]